jgi:hypothetical protein
LRRAQRWPAPSAFSLVSPFGDLEIEKKIVAENNKSPVPFYLLMKGANVKLCSDIVGYM